MEKIDGIAAIKGVWRSGSLAEDLGRLFSQWNGSAKILVWNRERTENGSEPKDGKQTALHLARLWAFDDILRRIASTGPRRTEEALNLATRYRLVTPVSGAVVLETKEQYQAAGLDAPGETQVPTIPEPEVWALLIIAAGALGWGAFTKRFTCKAA